MPKTVEYALLMADAMGLVAPKQSRKALMQLVSRENQPDFGQGFSADTEDYGFHSGGIIDTLYFLF